MPDAVVDEALPHHAIAEPGVAEHVDRAPLEDAGADAGHHVLPRLALEDDRLVTGAVQPVREHQPRRTAADDHDLRAGHVEEAEQRFGELSLSARCC